MRDQLVKRRIDGVRIVKQQCALTEVVENEPRKYEGKPGQPNRGAAKMTQDALLSVKRLPAAD